MTPDQQAERQQLRREIRQRRRALTERERHAASSRLCRAVGRSPLYRRSRHIALYLPNDGEPDLTPLIGRIWDEGKRCYLPILSPLYHNKLWFAPFTPETPLAANRFGIPEPHLPDSLRPAWALDLLLMPLVAFDNDGNRLGMGGGFYDRTLAYLSRRRHWRKPRLIGTAYEFQRHPGLPHQPWDMPLQGVVTENGLELFRSR